MIINQGGGARDGVTVVKGHGGRETNPFRVWWTLTIGLVGFQGLHEFVVLAGFHEFLVHGVVVEHRRRRRRHREK